MGTIGTILLVVGGLASFVAAIMVIIRIFKVEGAGLGILSIFCGIYTFIWGWMKHKQQGLKNIMLIWTGGLVLYVLGIVIAGAAAASSPEFKKAMEEGRRIDLAPPEVPAAP
jgi:hypothetical protein